jgi:MtN3 and saliva related transmembrane protein
MYHVNVSNHHLIRISIVTPEVIFGWAASTLCTFLLLPQILKAWSTKHTDDISMNMLVLSVAANGCWVVHAVLTGNIPLIVGASLICLMSFILIAFKFRFDSRF